MKWRSDLNRDVFIKKFAVTLLGFYFGFEFQVYEVQCPKFKVGLITPETGSECEVTNLSTFIINHLSAGSMGRDLPESH